MGHVACANNAWGNIASAIGTTDTTIALTSGQGTRFPATTNGDWFYMTLIAASGTLEIVKVTSRTGDILTVQRGADGTVPTAFPASSACELRPVAAWFKDFLAAFMARDGQYPATADLDMAGFTVKNVKNPVAAQDAVTLAFLNAKLPVGATMLWWGDYAANKAAIEAAGWHLCDGAGGTPDARGKMLRGNVANVAGDTGGMDSVTLQIVNMPNHTHGTTENPHTHQATEAAHTHTVTDPKHSHPVYYNGGGGPLGGFGGPATGGGANSYTDYAATGITLQPVAPAITVQPVLTNIAINATGGGQPYDNRPVFLGFHLLMRVA